MKRLIRFAMVTSVLLLAASSYGQSLAETAKKEKERREKNQNEGKTATEVDEYALKNAKGDTFSVTGKDPSGTSRWRRSSSASRSAATSRSVRSSTNSRTAPSSQKEIRDQCRTDLQKAEEEIKRQQALLDRGVAQVATIDTTKGPKPPKPEPGKEVYYPFVVVTTGPPIGFGHPEAKVDVEGTLVPCNQALGNSSKYPNEAKKCAEIKKKIVKADAKKQKALGCIQSR